MRLKAEALYFGYRQGEAALRGVTLALREGDYLLLAGANGAGKTTLVRHFLRLLQPDEGAVRVGGRPVAAIPFRELVREVGYVAQNPDTQLFNATVAEEVGFALRHQGLDEAAVRRRVGAMLEALGLEAVRDRHPLSLPRGLRARVVMAAVLALEPRTLILDEPTAGLDEAGTRRLLALTRRLREEGRTVVVISHHLEAIAPLATRMVVMAEGRILADGPTRAVMAERSLLRRAALLPPTVVEVGARLCPDSRLLTVEEVAGVVG